MRIGMRRNTALPARLLLSLSLALTSLTPLALGACASGGSARPARINQTLDDATLQTRVKTAILNDPQVGGDQIDVASVNGVVTLSGVIKAPENEARAAELAQQGGRRQKRQDFAEGARLVARAAARRGRDLAFDSDGVCLGFVSACS